MNTCSTCQHYVPWPERARKFECKSPAVLAMIFSSEEEKGFDPPADFFCGLWVAKTGRDDGPVTVNT